MISRNYSPHFALLPNPSHKRNTNITHMWPDKIVILPASKIELENGVTLSIQTPTTHFFNHVI